jgi:DNA repair exonuclease SbcCD nuclease subunit
MVRFLHTADIQLGMRATDAPEVADAVREQRFLTLERVVSLAQHEKVDFMVVAGDLFEDNQVSAETAYRTARILGSATPIAIYLLPGNHDPLSADSVYHRAAFGDRCPENVVVLGDATPVMLPACECMLCPCPLRERRSSFDPTEQWQGPLADAAVKVGVAHGSLAIESMHSGDDHPIRLDAAERLCLDYLALGHWHSYFSYDPHTVYAGTPEPTSFGDRDAGSVCLVSIKAPGALPSVERRSVGQLEWLLWDVNLAHASLDDVHQRVEALTRPQQTLLRVVLQGVADAGVLLSLDDLEAWLRAQGLLHVELRRNVVATQALMSALGELAEDDPVLAGVIADLQKLATLDAPEGAARGGAAAEALPVDELLALWSEAKGEEDVARPVAATEAIIQLARVAQEAVR